MICERFQPNLMPAELEDTAWLLGQTEPAIVFECADPDARAEAVG